MKPPEEIPSKYGTALTSEAWRGLPLRTGDYSGNGRTEGLVAQEDTVLLWSGGFSEVTIQARPAGRDERGRTTLEFARRGGMIDIAWLGPLSTYTDSVAANTVWQALGIPDHQGYSMVGNHAHCSFPASEQPDVDAYVLKFLVGGGTASTAIVRDTDNPTYNAAKWQPWTVPALP